MGIKGRRVHMIEELSETIISFQRGKRVRNMPTQLKYLILLVVVACLWFSYVLFIIN